MFDYLIAKMRWSEILEICSPRVIETLELFEVDSIRSDYLSYSIVRKFGMVFQQQGLARLKALKIKRFEVCFD